MAEQVRRPGGRGRQARSGLDTVDPTASGPLPGGGQTQGGGVVVGPQQTPPADGGPLVPPGGQPPLPPGIPPPGWQVDPVPGFDPTAGASEPLPLPPVPPPPPAAAPPTPALGRPAGPPAAQPRGTFAQPGTPGAAPFARGGFGRVFSRPASGAPAPGGPIRAGGGTPFASEGGVGGPPADDDLLVQILESLRTGGF